MPRTRRTFSECFDSRIVPSPSPGFGFFLSGAGVDAFEAVLVVPLLPVVPFFGFISLESLLEILILVGILSRGTF